MAASLRYCDAQDKPDVAVQDRLIQVAAIVKAELERSGQSVALVSRSGLALQRLNQRYSHTGIALQAGPHTPWSVRQLYYACDEKRPLIFDQGMSGFVLGASDATEGYVSIVLLPQDAAAALERTALDNRAALQLLGATYSANAYAFSQAYQNCNQWVIEMLASAWGALGTDRPTPLQSRTQAQAWLQGQGYTPTAIQVGWQPLMWLARRITWLHSDDHPAHDLDAARFRVSMPESIEAFVRQRLPEATRLELCYTERNVVLRRGWTPIGPHCEAAAGDEVVALQGPSAPMEPAAAKLLP